MQLKHDDEIKNKLHNIYLIVDDIKKFPQTYKTILKHLCKDGTCQTLLRRKINKLCKSGDICKTTIPGTRFGEAIFFSIPKKYYVIVEAGRTSNNVYCFDYYKKQSKFYIMIKNYWLLEGSEWKKQNKEKIIFEGNVLKFI